MVPALSSSVKENYNEDSAQCDQFPILHNEVTTEAGLPSHTPDISS